MQAVAACHRAVVIQAVAACNGAAVIQVIAACHRAIVIQAVAACHRAVVIQAIAACNGAVVIQAVIVFRGTIAETCVSACCDIVDIFVIIIVQKIVCGVTDTVGYIIHNICDHISGFIQHGIVGTCIAAIISGNSAACGRTVIPNAIGAGTCGGIPGHVGISVVFGSGGTGGRRANKGNCHTKCQELFHSCGAFSFFHSILHSAA